MAKKRFQNVLGPLNSVGLRTSCVKISREVAARQTQNLLRFYGVQQAAYARNPPSQKRERP